LSDHGESLGEYGLYLHGAPYAFAPDAQKHVPAVMWFGEGIKRDLRLDTLADRSRLRWSHDHVFATLLGLFELKTGAYRRDMDILEHSEETMSRVN
jgi:lipid A ethanolaminephosphotransferase